MRALIILVRLKAASPLLVGRALPTQKTAVVSLTGIGAHGLRRGLRLGLSLHGRAALVVLKCPIAVCPFLVGRALPIDETAVVDMGCGLRLRGGGVRNAGVADPARHPDFVSVSVDPQPSVQFADHVQCSARNCRFDNAGLEAGRGS